MHDDGILIGTTVTLASGGQQMTVESVTTDGDATCIWFSGEGGALLRAPFKRATLKPVAAQPTFGYTFTGEAAASDPPAKSGLAGAAEDLLQIEAALQPPPVPFAAEANVGESEPIAVTAPKAAEANGAACDGGYSSH